MLAPRTVHPGISPVAVVTKGTRIRATLLLAVAALRLVIIRAALVLRHLWTILLIHWLSILRLSQLLAILSAVVGVAVLRLVMLCAEVGSSEA